MDGLEVIDKEPEQRVFFVSYVCTHNGMQKHVGGLVYEHEALSKRMIVDWVRRIATKEDCAESAVSILFFREVAP